MKFKDMPYERINKEDLQEKYTAYLNELEMTGDPLKFKNIFNQINQYRGHIMTMLNLASIRSSIDASDTFYTQEREYWDMLMPYVSAYDTKFFTICLNYPYKDKLAIPPIFFKMAGFQQQCFNDAIIPLLQEENKLNSRYDRLKAEAKIIFKGKIENLSGISTYINKADRILRKEAYDAINDFYIAKEAEFDEIFDQMVQVRTSIAKELGFKNYTELSYKRMLRYDYDEQDIADYRQLIKKYVVPATMKLKLEQTKRLGLDKLAPYDNNIYFKNGNPALLGNSQQLIDAALKMYTEMSKETADFFNIMIQQELFDLLTKPNKTMGGYCTELYDFKVPFIFSNFNNTQADVDVLTHEAGHALQAYIAMQQINIPDLVFPTYEACEIHSMSMEFFAHPWMHLFFKDYNNYLYYHTAYALIFLPYGCLVDHFQQEIYNHPEMNKEERKACFASLEKEYLPYIDYSEYPALEKGSFFYRQGHIFTSPFYYIDYTLAQVCALQFYVRDLNKDPNTFKDYLHLCSLGGTKSFLDLVKEAGLKSPFNEQCFKETIIKIQEEINKLSNNLE